MFLIYNTDFFKDLKKKAKKIMALRSLRKYYDWLRQRVVKRQKTFANVVKNLTSSIFKRKVPRDNVAEFAIKHNLLPKTNPRRHPASVLGNTRISRTKKTFSPVQGGIFEFNYTATVKETHDPNPLVILLSKNGEIIRSSTTKGKEGWKFFTGINLNYLSPGLASILIRMLLIEEGKPKELDYDQILMISRMAGYHSYRMYYMRGASNFTYVEVEGLIDEDEFDLENQG